MISVCKVQLQIQSWLPSSCASALQIWPPRLRQPSHQTGPQPKAHGTTMRPATRVFPRYAGLSALGAFPEAAASTPSSRRSASVRMACWALRRAACPTFSAELRATSLQAPTHENANAQVAFMCWAFSFPSASNWRECCEENANQYACLGNSAGKQLLDLSCTSWQVLAAP